MKIPKGADLTKPSLSAGWIIGATIGAVLLMGVYLIATWLLGHIRSGTSAVTSKVTGGSGGSGDFFLR
jgi:hypothetical protein